MKKHIALFVLSLICFCIAGALEASAAEALIEFTPQSTIAKTDRNGQPYVMFIMEEARKLQGFDYKVGVPVMAFGSLATEAAKFPPGSKIKAIAKHNVMSDGRESYAIIGFVK